MGKAEHKGFGRPDDVRTFEKGRLELINVGTGQIGKLTLEPGWQWSKHVKSMAKTDLCMAPHFQYQVSGRIAVRMEDGNQFECGPADVSYLPEGHDAWVVGSEPVVVIDWAGAGNYAKA